MQMADRPDISVIIATYNRSADLARTLEDLARVRKDGLTVEVVVVDNNSADNTKEVVKSSAAGMPTRYLFEPNPGKNRALNLALRTVRLGRIVVFMDDDDTPAEDWFHSIVETCDRWPKHELFGGAIEVLWPGDPQSRKVMRARNSGLLFGGFAPAQEECILGRGIYPCGGNLWMRREVFDRGNLYQEESGPDPAKETMGSETLFLHQLAMAGHEIVYSPHAKVLHRIQPGMVEPDGVRRRAYHCGRARLHMKGALWPDLLKRSPLLWRLLCLIGITYCYLMCALARISLPRDFALKRSMKPVRDLGHLREAWRTAGKMRRQMLMREHSAPHASRPPDETPPPGGP